MKGERQMAEWKATRIIHRGKVRELCIDMELYTEGTDKEYSHMLYPLCSVSSPTLDDYENLAKDILNHSDLEKAKEKYGESYDELLHDLMETLINDCSRIHIEKVGVNANA